jgi:formate-nitrite transporter family protein
MRNPYDDRSGGEPKPARKTASEEHPEGHEEAEERRSPGGHIVYQAIQKEGEEELKRPSSGLAWSGLAAGLSMGFSFLAEALLRHYLPDAPWRPLISKLGYSVGFLIVVLGRQQLFTENTLTVILPLLRRWNARTVLNVLRLWTVVLGSNLVGAFAFAWILGHTSVARPELRLDFTQLGEVALAPGSGTLLVRGIFAGWLIALMVWLLPVAESARIWVIILLAYLVGLAEFSHIIAGSVETLFLVATGERSFVEYIVHYMLPTLGGNIMGGISLVAALAHAQFVVNARPGQI